MPRSAEQAVAGESFFQGVKHGNAARDGGSKGQAHAFLASQSEKLGAVQRDELLVGGDDGLAGLQGAAHQLLGGVEAADQLGDNVHVGRVENVVEAFRPLRVRWSPGDALAGDAAVADVGQLQLRNFALTEQAAHRRADSAEADQSHVPSSAGGSLRRGLSRAGGRMRFRCHNVFSDCGACCYERNKSGRRAASTWFVSAQEKAHCRRLRRWARDHSF